MKRKEEKGIFICAALLRLKWEILPIRSGVFKQVGDDLHIESQKQCLVESYIFVHDLFEIIIETCHI